MIDSVISSICAVQRSNFRSRGRRYSPPLLIASMLGLCLLVTASCSSQQAPNVIAASQLDLSRAAELLSEGKYAEALPMLDASILGGGLDPDQYAQALLLRSQCRALSGEHGLAEEDLAAAEQGAPSEAMVEFTKGILFHTQGKSRESKAAFARAARLDSNLKTPGWLP